MAIIQNIVSGKKVLLKPLFHVGREKDNQLTISDPDISRLHAIISWQNKNWHLHDQSRNGTMIDGRYLHQTSAKLKKKCVIQFGQHEGTKWQVLDLGPPCSYLRMMDELGLMLDLSKSHVYPDEKKPEVSFYRTENDRWQIDTGIQTMDLLDGNTYFFSNNEWLFVENESLEPTIETTDLKDHAEFELRLSDDEEDVRLIIRINDLEMDLEERVHHHVLLTLTRCTSDHVSPGFGWMPTEEIVSQLKKELVNPEIDTYYVNIQVHRLRKQLMEHAPYGYLFADIIERKNGRMRLRYPAFQIKKNGANVYDPLPTKT